MTRALVALALVLVTLVAPVAAAIISGPGSTLVSPTLASPTISGTVTGTPTWASAQTFPGATFGSTVAMGTNAITSTGTIGSGATFTAAVGAANATSYGFLGGTNDGMYTSGAGNINFATSGSQRLQITTSAVSLVGSMTLAWATDNATDLGAAGSTRPRTMYAGTSVISPLFRSDSAKVLVQGTGTGASQLAATQTTAPTCSASCGTSPSVLGTDTFMTVTMGASGVPASGFVVTFNGTWAAAPSCVGVPALAGMVVGKIPIVIATTTTTITVTTNGTAPATSDKYHFHCGGLS